MTGAGFASILNHMVKYEDSGLDATFGALADPTRRGILSRLSLREASVSELAAPFGRSLPAIMKHVGVLERAGLVVCRKRGRVRYCRLAAQPLRAAGEWINLYRRFWEGQFDALEQFLTETEEEESR